jgi:hypothetical protein
MPLPTWLKDQRFLNPLLSAYDARLARLDTDGRKQSSVLQQLQEQVLTRTQPCVTCQCAFQPRSRGFVPLAYS